MYARTALLALVLLATSAPCVIAAPAVVETSQLARRDILDLLTRQVAELHAREHSGALSWQGIYDWGNSALDKLQGLTPTIQSGAGIYMAAHDVSARDVEASRVFKRDELTRDLHIITRAIIEERDIGQSGGIDWQDVKDFGKGFVDGFTKTVSTALPIVGAFVKREDLDIISRNLVDGVVVRAVEDAEFGVIDWQDVKDFGKGFVDGFTKTVSTALPIVGAFVKREDLEMIARELDARMVIPGRHAGARPISSAITTVA